MKNTPFFILAVLVLVFACEKDLPLPPLMTHC